MGLLYDTSNILNIVLLLLTLLLVPASALATTSTDFRVFVKTPTSRRYNNSNPGLLRSESHRPQESRHVEAFNAQNVGQCLHKWVSRKLSRQ